MLFVISAINASILAEDLCIICNHFILIIILIEVISY